MANHTPLVEAWIRYAEDDWQDSQILATSTSQPVCSWERQWKALSW